MNIPFTQSDLSSLGLHEEDLLGLLSRLDLWSQILRRQEEEAIVNIVELDSAFVEESRKTLLGDYSIDDYLSLHRLSASDFDINVRLSECLRLFSEQHFGPGIEEAFLSSQGGHDQIIYSLIRVKDNGLARELWIRLEEGEDTFSELASTYGEGPEAAKRGVIGPTPIGSIHPPELASLLRSLQCGEIHPPRTLGEWVILIRLEQLTPARLDTSMRAHLLRQQLDAFLDARVKLRLSGSSVDKLTYYS